MTGRFEHVCRLMVEILPSYRKEAGYRSICRQAGVSPAKTESMFYEEFGMSAAEIMEKLCMTRE